MVNGLVRSISVAIAACALCAAISAEAQSPTKPGAPPSATARKDASVKWMRGMPFVSFDVAALADKKVRNELRSGLRKRFVVIVESHLAGSRAKIATRRLECAITYDLWDDGYLVRVGERVERQSTLDEVVRRCLVVKDLAVGLPNEYVRHRGKQIFFQVRAEFNPISERQCREMVRSSRGGGDAIGPIAVNIVRRRICAAEAAVEFESRKNRVPEP